MLKQIFMAAIGASACLLAAQASYAENLDYGKAEKVGMSSERLERIDDVMNGYIDQGQLAGAVTMVARKGKIVHFKTFGVHNMETGQYTTTDSIFRIYSMSKPVTTVAAMQLYEQGKFQLTDPVEKYIPELKGMKVWADGETVAQKKPFTIQQLMSHTGGLSYGFSPVNPVDKLYREKQVLGSKDLQEMVTRIGEIPLLTQPGEAWRYSVSVDVLGRLVEVISGQPLDEYLAEHIFQPLGMTDTFFEVPKSKLDRFGTNHRYDRRSGKLVVSDKPESSPFANNVTLFSGGGGLLSTAEDYMRFSQMLLNGGELKGVRILGRKTIQYMTKNHIGNLTANLSGEGATDRPGQGFGLGFGVVLDPAAAGVISSKGEYNWGGAAGTIFWVDPKEELIAIVMIQHMNVQIPLRNTFKALAYGAITE